MGVCCVVCLIKLVVCGVGVGLILIVKSEVRFCKSGKFCMKMFCV